MSAIKIYHGSINEIAKPTYGFGKSRNDYGLGFYCTEDIELAKEWAVNPFHSGFANAYEIDLEGLTILDLRNKQFTVLHWLAILLENRTFEMASGLALEAKKYIMEHFLPEYKSYDIIIGYRADDSYFSYAQDFLNGMISYRQLSNAMKLGNLGIQFVLKSERAFQKLRFIGSEQADKNEWYQKKISRDLSARNEYLNSERYNRVRGDLYIINILDEEVKEDDARLQ